jgi:hypothetical protein
MIALGLILLIIGLVAGIPVLTTIGVILLVVGLILNLVPIGGSTRRVWSRPAPDRLGPRSWWSGARVRPGHVGTQPRGAAARSDCPSQSGSCLRTTLEAVTRTSATRCAWAHETSPRQMAVSARSVVSTVAPTS